MIKKICLTFSLLAFSTIALAEGISGISTDKPIEQNNAMMQARQQCFTQLQQDKQMLERARNLMMQHKQQCLSAMQQQRQIMQQQRQQKFNMMQQQRQQKFNMMQQQKQMMQQQRQQKFNTMQQPNTQTNTTDTQ